MHQPAHLPLAIYHLPSAICHLPFAVGHRLSAIGYSVASPRQRSLVSFSRPSFALLLLQHDCQVVREGQCSEALLSKHVEGLQWAQERAPFE